MFVHPYDSVSHRALNISAPEGEEKSVTYMRSYVPSQAGIVRLCRVQWLKFTKKLFEFNRDDNKKEEHWRIEEEI